MREMIALQQLTYDSKPIAPGVEFPCEDGHVETLMAIGKAKCKEPRPGDRKFPTRALNTETPRAPTGIRGLIASGIAHLKG